MWTKADQRALEELQKRKAEFDSKTRGALIAAVQRADLGAFTQLDDICDTLIANADEFRDALAPFDSGVRCAPAPSVDEGWINWPVSNRALIPPVAPWSNVEVKFQNGKTQIGPHSSFIWDLQGTPISIVAYRVLAPANPGQPMPLVDEY